MYSRALQFARQEDFDKATLCFEGLLADYPDICTAWVSYAQVLPRDLGRSLGCCGMLATCCLRL
jgi:hypothetical protein